MSDNNRDLSLSCQTCIQEMSENKKSGIVNCLGCQELFCLDHFVKHREYLTDLLEQLAKEHTTRFEDTYEQLNIDKHLAQIDQWELQTIETVQIRAQNIRERIRSLFQTYKWEFQQYRLLLEKDFDEKRKSRAFIETDISQLAQQVEKLRHEIEHMDKMLHQFNIKELYQPINISIPSSKTKEQTFDWTFVNEISLDSSYAHMAANEKQIFLGWKDRIAIYNHDGTKQDETRIQSLVPYGELCDLAWSSTMQRLFILCRKSAFVYQPSKSPNVQLLSQISRINVADEYVSLATFVNHLCILRRQDLDVQILNGSTWLLGETNPIETIVKNPQNESICCIRSDGQNLAILIQNNKQHTWRIDLFSIGPVQCIRTGIGFDRFVERDLGIMMSLNNGYYLFSNWETKIMRLINQQGDSQMIDYNAFNACSLGTQRKIAVNYMTYLKIYQF